MKTGKKQDGEAPVRVQRMVRRRIADVRAMNTLARRISLREPWVEVSVNLVVKSSEPQQQEQALPKPTRRSAIRHQRPR